MPPYSCSAMVCAIVREEKAKASEQLTRWRSPLALWAGITVLLILAQACATPVSVTQVDPRAVHQELTRSVLSAGSPSGPTQVVLNRADLYGRFDEDPEGALRVLHGEVATGKRGPDQIFALAELSFLHAERTKGRPHHLAAALYAYTFLFPPPGTEPPSPFDPRFRVACDLYNRGLTAGFASKDGTEVEFQSGAFPLPFGMLEVAFDPAQLDWSGHTLEHFVPVADLEVRELRNRYRRP